MKHTRHIAVRRRCEVIGFMPAARAAFEFMFGCHHRNLSRVFTLRRRTYRVCYDCGAEFDYSLATMSIERRCPQRAMKRLDPTTGQAYAAAWRMK